MVGSASGSPPVGSASPRVASVCALRLGDAATE
jgi:hypothetical protein